MLKSYDYGEKCVLVLVHKPEQPGIQQTVTRLVSDRDFAKLINDCFFPIGIMNTSNEIKVLLKLLPIKAVPCLAILRSTPKDGRKKVQLEDSIPLFTTANTDSVAIEGIHHSVANYLKKRNSQGSRFHITERGSSELARKRQLEGERE